MNINIVILFLIPVFVSADISTNASLTRYYLWTRENPSSSQEVLFGNIESFQNSNFNVERKTKVLVHGYTGNGRQSWVINVKNRFLEKGKTTKQKNTLNYLSDKK